MIVSQGQRPPVALQPQSAAATAPQSFAGVSPAVADVARLFKQQQEAAALLEEAKKHLPVPYRDDGPPLGFEFDDIPGWSFAGARLGLVLSMGLETTAHQALEHVPNPCQKPSVLQR